MRERSGCRGTRVVDTNYVPWKLFVSIKLDKKRFHYLSDLISNFNAYWTTNVIYTCFKNQRIFVFVTSLKNICLVIHFIQIDLIDQNRNYYTNIIYVINFYKMGKHYYIGAERVSYFEAKNIIKYWINKFYSTKSCKISKIKFHLLKKLTVTYKLRINFIKF